MSTAMYATPQANLIHTSGAIALREKLIRHESSIRAVGSLFVLSAALEVALALAMLAGAKADPSALLWVALFYLGLSGVHGWVGLGLRRLDRSTRVAAGVLCGVGLLAFPIGTLFCGYVLYLLFSSKGGEIFAESYREVVAQTPDVRAPTSRILIGLFLTLLAVIAAALVASLFS